GVLVYDLATEHFRYDRAILWQHRFSGGKKRCHGTVVFQLSFLRHGAQVIYAGWKADDILGLEIAERAPVGVEVLLTDMKGGKEPDLVDVVVTVYVATLQVSGAHQALAAEPGDFLAQAIAVAGTEVIL